MLVAHVKEEERHEGYLENEIEPRFVDEEREEERDCPRVEGQDVRVLHQWAASLQKGFPDMWRNMEMPRFVTELFVERLESGSHLLLRTGVTDVEKLERFGNQIILPAECLIERFQILGVTQFTARFSFQEKKVDVAVIVCQLALFGVADETGKGGNQPNPDAPLVVEPHTDGEIDGEEPKVARKTVEHTSEFGLLSGHACQLSVCAVIHVGPDEQQHPDDIDVQVFEVKTIAGSHSQQDG